MVFKLHSKHTNILEVASIGVSMKIYDKISSKFKDEFITTLIFMYCDILDSKLINKLFTEHINLNAISFVACKFDSEIIFKKNIECLLSVPNLTDISLNGFMVKDWTLNKAIQIYCINFFLHKLKESKYIHSISLSHLEYKAVKKIGDVIKVNPSINKLTLSNICNKPKTENFDDLISAVKYSDNLIYLKIRYSNVDDNVSDKIADLLQNNTTLLELDLSCNDITSKGIDNIFSSLQQNKSLSKINILENKKENQDVKYIKEAIILNNSLTVIDADAIEEKSKEEKFIFSWIEHNKTTKAIASMFPLHNKFCNINNQSSKVKRSCDISFKWSYFF